MSLRTARFALIASIAWPIAAQAQSVPAAPAKAEDDIVVLGTGLDLPPGTPAYGATTIDRVIAAVKKFRSTWHGNVVVHQHAVDITNYILNGHGHSDIKKRRRYYKVRSTFQQMLEQNSVEHGAFDQRERANRRAMVKL